MSDAGSERGGRRNFEQGDGKVRDFSNWERKGPLPPTSPPATSLREGGRQRSKDGAQFRHNSPSWGEGRSQEGSRPPRREYHEKPIPERAPTAAELDNQWRARMKAPEPAAKSPTPETSSPPSPAQAPPPATRPKLQLQKRTVSEAEPAFAPAPVGDSKSSPFGAARPVDTASKEKEVEEKLQLAIRQRREAEEKARAERAEEKRLAKEKTELEKGSDKEAREIKEVKESKENKETKENGAEPSQPTPKFDILRRVDSATNDMVATDDDGEGDEETADAAVSEDKAVKPKEVVQNATSTKANGATQNQPSRTRHQAPATTAESLEEDGWSTVSKPNKQRNQRRNFHPTRALAS